MTRKHFRKLADLVDGLDLGQVEKLRVAKAIADFCMVENERFDYVRFLDACGVHAKQDA